MLEHMHVVDIVWINERVRNEYFAVEFREIYLGI